MRRLILDWLQHAHPSGKMLFLAGARQVGKTTLTRQALEATAAPGLYLNWDIAKDRRRIRLGEDLLAPLRGPGKRPLVVFDELHKMRTFKSWLKGFFDEHRDEIDIWVTGSARLDLFQKGGDSLLGRYFLYRLHPLSVGEIAARPAAGQPIAPERFWDLVEADRLPKGADAATSALLRFGGFPEPFLKGEATFHRRWIASRRERITHEDLRDLTRIQDLDKVEHLVELLNPRIGSPLSLNSLREDLEVAFETVRAWVAALERVYYVFGVRPYARRIQRSLRRERKLYFWDWSEVEDPAARFENLVLAHLQKACDIWNDFGLGEFALWYLRDKEKREVDALVTRARRPWLLVEVKQNDREPAKPLERFAADLDCPHALQVVEDPELHLRVRRGERLIHILGAARLLACLP